MDIPYHRHALSCLVLAPLALAACVMSNPSWDPPSAGGQSETGMAEAGEAEGVAESGHDVSTDGEENPIDDDDEDEGPDEGDGDGDGEGEGDGDGEQLVCGQASKSFGPCPPGCDECYGGTCWKFCGQGECHDAFLLCPVSWSCHVLCIGKDSCKDATVACSGWGKCEVECLGSHACTKADILCAGGPCNVTCGAGFERPCEYLDVRCGSNRTQLHCKEPYEGGGPELNHQGFGPCECTSDCVPKDDDD